LKKLRYLLSAAIGLALLAWVIQGLDLSQMGKTLRSADYGWLLPSGAAMLGMFALRALRWKYLLIPIHAAGGAPSSDVSFGALWSGVLIGYFGNFALTANAGELMRAFVVGQRENRSKSAVLGSIFVEKALDVLVLLGCLALLSFTVTLPAWAAWMMALGVLLSIAAGFVLFLLPRWEAKITTGISAPGGRLSAAWAARLERLIRNFVAGLEFPRQGGAMIQVGVLSCVIWPVLAVAFFCIGRSVGLSVAPQAYLLLVALVTLGAIIPTLPGQIGTTEFLVVGGLGVFGVEKEPALSFVILLRLVRVLPLSLGYASLLRAGLGLADIRSWPTRETQSSPYNDHAHTAIHSR